MRVRRNESWWRIVLRSHNESMKVCFVRLEWSYESNSLSFDILHLALTPRNKNSSTIVSPVCTGIGSLMHGLIGPLPLYLFMHAIRCALYNNENRLLSHTVSNCFTAPAAHSVKLTVNLTG